jgi:enoyl-CoA hydratase/carnithine racemase
VKALNALCNGLVKDLIDATSKIDQDSSVGAIVLTGSNKAFAAGADIKEMANKTFVEAFSTDMFAEVWPSPWDAWTHHIWPHICFVLAPHGLVGRQHNLAHGPYVADVHARLCTVSS